MSFRMLSLAVLSFACLAIAPVASAQADGRYGSYYGDDGWEGGYYPAPRFDRPPPAYREDYQPYDEYRRPWGGRQAYVPYADEPGYPGPDGYGEPMMRPRTARPPRTVSVAPAPPRRLPAAKPKSVVSLPPKKPEAVRPRIVVVAPSVKPAPAVTPPMPIQEANVLPVPRPNLESMDFESPAQAPR